MFFVSLVIFTCTVHVFLTFTTLLDSWTLFKSLLKSLRTCIVNMYSIIYTLHGIYTMDVVCFLEEEGGCCMFLGRGGSMMFKSIER